MSKQEKKNIVENIKNIFDKYKSLAIKNEDKDNEDLLNLQKESEEVIKRVQVLRNFSLIIYTFLVIVVAGLFYSILKLQSAYDKIYDLNIEQSETRFDSINKVITGLKFISNDQVKDTNTVSYYSRTDGTIITYQDMSDDRDTLFKKNQILKNDYEDVKAQLDLVKKHYPIKTTVKRYTKNNSQTVTYTVESKKIDEALDFYEQYKDEVEEMDKKSN